MDDRRNKLNNSKPLSGISFRDLDGDLVGDGDSAQAQPEVRTEYIEVIPDNALVKEDDYYVIKGAKLDRTGIEMPDFDPADEDQYELQGKIWQQVALFVFDMAEVSQLWIGDLINYGLERFNVSIDQLAQATGREIATLDKYARVCKSVDKRLRRKNLYFSHYELVYSKPDLLKEDLLRKASEGDWTVERLRDEIQPKGATKQLPADAHWLSIFDGAPGTLSGYKVKIMKAKNDLRRGNVEKRDRLRAEIERIRMWADAVLDELE